MFQVKMTRDEGFTDQQWERELESAYWWQKCWNDDGFQALVLGYQQTATQCTGHLWWKKCTTVPGPAGFTYTGDTPRLVLDKMLSGAEVLRPQPDGTADVEVACASQRGVLGWTYPNTLKEWVSGWFVDESPIWALAGNRGHEYAHKLGYDHPFNRTWDRPFSVPYAIGDLTLAWVQANYVESEWHLSQVSRPPKVAVESLTV